MASRSLSWTIFRYILAEALFAFLVSFLFFFFIFFVNQLLLMAREILTKHVPLGQVALLVLFSIPSIIAISAPFAALVGILMTVGRLTSDNEILVMLSSGLSYKNIFLPAIVVGVGISMVSFFANDVLLPAGSVQFAKLYRRILLATPALELEANSVKRFKNTVIVTGGVTGNAIDNVLILDRTNSGERRIIMARTAELKDGGRQGLSLDLERAFVQSSREIVREDYDYASSTFLRYWVPQEDLVQGALTIGPNQMSSRDLGREIQKKIAELAEKLEERKTRIMGHALALEEALRTGADDEGWNRRTRLLALYQQEIQGMEALMAADRRSISNYRLEYYKKFSIPFGAFSFVFLAVSLGLLAKKSGQTVGFIFGLIISVIYWALLLGGQTLGIRLGYNPFWSMWFPNVLAIGAGLVLALVRIRR
ncbi:MAG: LptF/LptG family permease [Treponema sp.]|jgi:lipopolysaccharide export system permease protein|nr:LptF/LptG family permease [Treponema sp.]